MTEKKSFNSKRKFPLLIFCGEHSGDILGAEVLKEIKKYISNLDSFGVGGDQMKSENFRSIEKIENLSIIGFSEILKKYSFLKKLLNSVLQLTLEKECKVALLIDYPGFNLRLAEKLKKNGVHVIYLVSPQIWAWNFNRIYHIQKNIDLMLTLFSFEDKIYQEYNVNSFCIGHPIGKRIKEKIRKETSVPSQFDQSIKITLMPGSRNSEIKYHLEILLDSALLIKKEFPKKKIRFFLPNINESQHESLREKIRIFNNVNTNCQIEYYFGNSLKCMQSSDLILLASGTSTLEAAYFEKPMVILYKVSFLNYLIGSILMKIKFVGLVNILSNEEICKELLQMECTANNVASEAILIISNRSYRSTMIQKIKKIKSELEHPNPARNASVKILEFLKRNKII